jgi:hypothetical protein
VTYGVLRRIESATLPSANHPRWPEIMAAVQLREYAEPSRRSRWLRIVDDNLDNDSAVA